MSSRLFSVSLSFLSSDWLLSLELLSLLSLLLFFLSIFLLGLDSGFLNLQLVLSRSAYAPSSADMKEVSWKSDSPSSILFSFVGFSCSASRVFGFSGLATGVCVCVC